MEITFLSLICVLGFANAHPSGYIYPKPARPYTYSTESNLVKATSSLDCDPIQHTVSANNNEQHLSTQEEQDFQTNNQQAETDQFDDTVVIEPLESEEHNIGIAVAVADENESEEPVSTVLEHVTFKPEEESNIGSSTTDVGSSTNNGEYHIDVSKLHETKNKHHKVTAIFGKGTELPITESFVPETPTTESADNFQNKLDAKNHHAGSETGTAKTQTQINGGYGSETSVIETKFIEKAEPDSKPETIDQNETVKTQDNKDKKGDGKYTYEPSSFFPIYFGAFPSAKSSSGSGAVISIANSFSTGRGGVASSHATASGSRRTSQKSTR